MSVFILDKDAAELLAQFSRLKQTKISRLGSDWIDLEGGFWSRLKNDQQQKYFIPSCANKVTIGSLFALIG